MSSVDAHAHPNPSETDAHGEGTELEHEAHGDHGDPASHGAPSESLGPVDTRAWAAAIGGALLGIVVIVALYLAIQG